VVERVSPDGDLLRQLDRVAEFPEQYPSCPPSAITRVRVRSTSRGSSAGWTCPSSSVSTSEGGEGDRLDPLDRERGVVGRCGLGNEQRCYAPSTDDRSIPVR